PRALPRSPRRAELRAALPARRADGRDPARLVCDRRPPDVPDDGRRPAGDAGPANRLYEHLQSMSLRFFTATRTGELQSRLQNDVGGVQSVVTNTASSVLSNVVTILSTVIAMVVLSWQLTLLALGVVPVFVFLTWRVGR